MQSMGVSEFKAKCIAVLKEARRSGQAVIVTHRGKPLARVEPIMSSTARRLGGMKATGRILGEIVQVDFDRDWDMERR